MLLMQRCNTKCLGLTSTYMYLAYELDVYMQVVCEKISHIVVELCILVACMSRWVSMQCVPASKQVLPLSDLHLLLYGIVAV